MRTEELFVQIINVVVEITPRNEGEQAIRVRLLDMVQKTSDRRDERVAKSLTRIPPTLAALVNTVAGVLVLLIFVYPFRYWVTGALCFTLAGGVIWLANLVMMDTDNPLKGIWNVSPQSFADLRL
jgi:fatty acid desaturase